MYFHLIQHTLPLLVHTYFIHIRCISLVLRHMTLPPLVLGLWMLLFPPIWVSLSFYLELSKQVSSRLWINYKNKNMKILAIHFIWPKGISLTFRTTDFGGQDSETLVFFYSCRHPISMIYIFYNIYLGPCLSNLQLNKTYFNQLWTINCRAPVVAWKSSKSMMHTVWHLFWDTLRFSRIARVAPPNWKFLDSSCSSTFHYNL